MKAPQHYALLPLMDGFGASWELANEALAEELGQGPLVVLDGVDRAGLSALRDELAGKLEAVRAQELAARVARARGAYGRRALRVGLVDFNATVRAWWAEALEGAVVPEVERELAALDRFLRPVRDALRLWARLDAGVAPPGVVLPLTVGPGELDRAGMGALMAGVLEARDAEEEAEFLLGLARVDRDRTERRVRAVLAAFIRAVKPRLGEDHAVVEGMPALYPPRGHTPEPVKAQGRWDGEAGMARLTWEGSGDAALSHYEVRWSPGESYDRKKERVAGRVEGAGAERTLLTVEGLRKPGAVASFRVYVVLSTGNERGSAPVTVWAPAGAAD